MTMPSAIPTIDVRSVDEARRPAGGPRPLVVDVRNPDEFDEVRIEGAVIVPLPDFTTRFAELPTDRPLYLVCRSGNRSAAAAAFLLRNGYEDVANVVGGMMAWEQAGLAVVRGPAAPGEGDLPGS